MKIIDISVPINDKIPLWPKSFNPKVIKIARIGKKSAANETKIETSVHIGTHIDAPNHFIPGRNTIDKSPIETFLGKAFVICLPKAKEITAEHLDKFKIPKNTSRILFHTSNSLLWKKTKKFKIDYVGLTVEAAYWMVKHKIKLVGIDYISIAKFSEAIEVHKILLGNDIHILESLNLTGIKSGSYTLISLPIKISGSEAAPSRAVLLKS